MRPTSAPEELQCGGDRERRCEADSKYITTADPLTTQGLGVVMSYSVKNPLTTFDLSPNLTLLTAYC